MKMPEIKRLLTTLVLSSVMLLLFAAGGCEKKGSYGPSSAASGGVTGHVYLAGSLKPVANIIVSCGGAVDTTAKSGHYSLSNVPIGSQDISATNSYYQTFTSKITVRGNEITTLDIFMSYSNK
jgi:hypothetical protein